MKYKIKYKIKNPLIEQAVFGFFDKRSVVKSIKAQMADQQTTVIYLTSTENWGKYSVRLNKDFSYVREQEGTLGFRFPKSEIEIESTVEYEPCQWNPFPEAIPPEPKKYLVQYMYTRTGEKILSTATWYLQGYWIYHGDEHDGDPDYNEADGWIVAFRELPPFYEPEKQE